MNALVTPPNNNLHRIQTTADRESTEVIAQAMASLVNPASGYLGCKEVLSVALGIDGRRLIELGSLSGGIDAHRLMALRYLIENGAVWFKYYQWETPLSRIDPEGPQRARDLWEQIGRAQQAVAADPTIATKLGGTSLSKLAGLFEKGTDSSALETLVALSSDDQIRADLRTRWNNEAPGLLKSNPAAVDLVYLLSQDLRRLPATTVGATKLKYVIVADKGEMGTRAVREAAALGLVPIVVYSEQDDGNALQVRLAEAAEGHSIPLVGGFRESYANPNQIAKRVLHFFGEHFGDAWEEELQQAAIYPGYGPLAESTAANGVFRRNGITFIGPMQDVVERAGDKRKFRLMAQRIDPNAVTPGIVMDESDDERIAEAVYAGARDKKFSFPGRLKAANGGGGRGQVVIDTPEQVPEAVQKVLEEIRSNGWDQGVMFEQNIFETIHLEVQILRDRFGNTRHFGMRDCSEQRASQKIQEEAPPALLRDQPELVEEMCRIAVRIADEVAYVGAATVELMFKNGHFYLLEMNTRIQVEHPVTEASHRIRHGDELLPLNLVALQYKIAQGLPLEFSQDDVVQTHVAREFRINAESFKPNIKDPRDGKKGLFLPNAGVFDVLEIPEAEEVQRALEAAGTHGIDELFVRFDCGFEVGDDLVNKDPTFGKLIVSVRANEANEDQRYELLRLASIEALRLITIEGRQLLPNGKILEDLPLETNVRDHIRVLETDMMKKHSRSQAQGRHVNWLIEMLRAESPTHS